MSYSLRYGESRYDKRPTSKRKKQYMVAFAVLLSVIVLYLLFPAQLTQVRRYLLPFLEPTVQEAFISMAESIDGGSSLGEAAGVFCREIISEAVH